jgi:hypothetical protein
VRKINHIQIIYLNDPIMKSFYILAAALATLLFVNEASAQYVAVRSGNWNDDGASSVWIPGAKPPAVCNGCTITINSGAIVTLNTSVTLNGNSVINIGSGGASAASIVIPASGGTDFPSSYNLILHNDGSNPGSQIVLGNDSSFLTATGAGEFDGVLISLSTAPVTYLKQIGNAPSIFSGATVAGGPGTYGLSLTGPVTLTVGSILPIILTNFTAELNKSQVQLNWETSIEENSDHFDVLRLDPANSTWETIGKVAAQGNSSLPVQYAFTDENPRPGVNDYRLQSVDKDGKTALSEIKAVTLGAIEAKIFPNPASDYVNVNLSGTAAGTQSIRLFNQSGQLLIEKKVDNGAGTIVSLPITNFPQGNYLIIVTGPDGSRQVSKLFISRL